VQYLLTRVYIFISVCVFCSCWSLVQSSHLLQKQCSHHPVKLLNMPLIHSFI